MIRADHIYMWAITISVTLWRMHEGRMHQLWRMHRRHEIGQQIAFNSILDKILPACGSQLSSLFAHWADFLLSMALLIQKVTLILEDRGRVKRAEVALQAKESSCTVQNLSFKSWNTYNAINFLPIFPLPHETSNSIILCC